MELYDPEANQVFVKELKRILASGIPIEEVDLHISDPAFALRAVETLDRLIQSRTKKSK